MKVALVHDWLVSYRGGEKVLEAIADFFPDAPIYTLFYKKGSVGKNIESHRIVPSWLNRVPFASRQHRYFLPLLPKAIESFKLENFDLVVSSSHCVAKGIRLAQGTPHICYSHTPMRYVWDKRNDYFKTPIQRLVAPFFIPYLQHWDANSNGQVTHFIANSNFVQKRIAAYYQRESEVIYPFADDFYFDGSISEVRDDYYLIVCGFAPYKRIDLALEACKKTGRKLLVVGDGQDKKKLLQWESQNITFLGKVSDHKLRDLYAKAKAMLFPGEEDFGIAPVEAMAMGCPVVAFGKGGLTETVLDRKTGMFFPVQTVDSLIETMDAFEKNEHEITPELCRTRALQFSRSTFKEKFRESYFSVMG